MKDAAYYRWLDSPLTSVEQADLARIERKHQLVQRLSDQVAAVAGRLRAFYSAWPRRRWSIYKLDELAPKTSRRASGITLLLDPSRFDLTVGESEYWPALLEKKGRPAYLAQFEYNPDANNGFIARLEREKPLLSSSEQLSHYLADQLAIFNQQHEEFLTSESISRLPDEARHYRIIESRNRRAEEYRSYITDALNRLNQADSLTPTNLNESVLSQPITPHSKAVIEEPAKLGLRQIALLYFFDKSKPNIKRDSRATEIAISWGHTSGAKLYDHFRVVKQEQGITGATGKELPSMIEDIEAILPLLVEPYKKEALKALNKLQLKLD